MKVHYILLSLLFSISLLLFASCGSKKKVATEEQIEQPRPVSDPGLDSLKTTLDQERERRKAKGKK